MAVKVSVEHGAPKPLLNNAKFARQLLGFWGTESATADFFPFPAMQMTEGVDEGAGVGEERCDNRSEAPKRRERSSPVLECSRALSHCRRAV